MRRLNTWRSALVILSAVWAAPDGAWAARPDEDRWSEGASVAELNRMFDEIRDSDPQAPFVKMRAKRLAAIFDHGRIMARPDDVFVDWMPDRNEMQRRRAARIRAWQVREKPFGGGDALWGRSHGGYWTILDTSHVCPDWESILSLGPKGLADRARARLRTAKSEKERIFLACVVEVYEAMSRLCLRWADLCDRRGNASCAKILRDLAVRPPETLREAIQLMFLYDRGQELEGQPVRTQGLFDRLYLRFYRADLAAGRETRESARKLVREMFRVFYEQQATAGKNIAFGGYDRAGAPVWNELTEIAFEVHHEHNHESPKLTYRFGRKTPHEQLLKVARCVANGRNAIVFPNDETCREMLMRRGISAEDTADLVMIGCYEPAVQGREVIASMAANLNLAKPLESVLNDGCYFDGFRIASAGEALPDYAAFEAAYLRHLGTVIDTMLADTCRYETNWYDLNPSPFMSGAFRDCIANAKDAYDGGMKYNQSGVMCAGLGTAVDSLAVVRQFVYEQKAVTLRELAAILRADWKGYEELRLKARRLPPKWGNNDERADAIGRRIYAFAAQRINAMRNGHGGTFQAGFWSIDQDISFGRQTGATPDGRRKGEMLSRNNVATAGCGKEGPTAAMLSNAKLDTAEAANGHVVDIILPATRDAGGAVAAERVAAMLETHARLGGQCIQFNCFNADMLRDAQAHPDKYPDLQVRVCGWNVRWNDLSKLEQDMFIKTAEGQE